MRNANYKNYIKLLLSFSFIYLFLPVAYGQKLESWMKEGDYSFFVEKDYRTAFNYYQAATSYDSTRVDIWVKMAESARNMQGLQTAKSIYTKVLSFPDSVLTPENFYYAAFLKKFHSLHWVFVQWYHTFFDFYTRCSNELHYRVQYHHRRDYDNLIIFQVLPELLDSSIVQFPTFTIH
jgi:tetratricopeptide (TPR) repeat protein